MDLHINSNFTKQRAMTVDKSLLVSCGALIRCQWISLHY